MAYQLRWGIMATGWIAEKFTIDLLIDPATRNTHDVAHVVAAIASSSGKDRAESFREKVKAPRDCACYGNYDELVTDSNVDAIYVATPHSHHYQNVLQALEAGKHVVCEKPITVNAAQAKVLYDTAKARKLFMLDAVWTRYFPLSVNVRKLIQENAIGEVLRVVADTSMGESMDDLWLRQKRRKVNLDLAGGALLEIGIYSITWIFQTLYHTLPREQRKQPSTIMSHMIKYPETGVDEDTSFIISFPTTTPSNLPNRGSHGVGMTAFPLASNPDDHNSAGPTIRIQGTKGEIQVFGMAFQPDRYKVIPLREGDEQLPITEVHCPFPAGGHGMYYEADEAARCIRDGLSESETMPWDESILIMEVMDKIREQGELQYPAAMESTERP